MMVSEQFSPSCGMEVAFGNVNQTSCPVKSFFLSRHKLV
jgi:hypothetical protein